MATLKYTTREINSNYKIKVSGMLDGKKINTLVGVSGLMELVNDIELTNRLLDRAFNNTDDVCVCKLRRGIKISFYVYLLSNINTLKNGKRKKPLCRT